MISPLQSVTLLFYIGYIYTFFLVSEYSPVISRNSLSWRKSVEVVSLHEYKPSNSYPHFGVYIWYSLRSDNTSNLFVLYMNRSVMDLMLCSYFFPIVTLELLDEFVFFIYKICYMTLYIFSILHSVN